MSFARMELLVDVDNRILVKSVTQVVPVQASTRPKFIYADTLVLACKFIDKNGDAYPLNAGDTFDCGLDDDFEHNLDTGTTSAGYSGAVVSIVVSGLTQQSLIPSTGHIVLINGADESDRVAYTAFDGTDTFTVSTTLSNTYLLGDEVQVQDDLMAYSDDTQVDIAGDWADIDRATGKISIRINCLTDSFLRKIAEGDTNGQLLTWLQIRRVPNTETEYTTMMQDYCYSYNSVIGSLGGAGNTFIDYITQTQGDARWLKIGEGVLGPGSSTDNAIMRWHGTAGADAQNSLVTIDDTGKLTMPAVAEIEAATSLDLGAPFVGINGALPIEAENFGVESGDNEIALYLNSPTGHVFIKPYTNSSYGAVVDASTIPLSIVSNQLRVCSSASGRPTQTVQCTPPKPQTAADTIR